MELGGDDAGAERLDPDSLGCQLLVKRLAHRDDESEGPRVDRTAHAALNGRLRGRAAEREHPRHVDDRPLAAGEHAGHSRTNEHRRSENLDVDEFARLIDGKLRDRHVMRDPGIVDEHRQRSRGACLRDDGDSLVGGQVGDQRLDRDVGKRCDELSEPVGTSTRDDEVVAVGSEALGERPADTGRGSGDECELVHGALPFVWASEYLGSHRIQFSHAVRRAHRTCGP